MPEGFLFDDLPNAPWRDDDEKQQLIADVIVTQGPATAYSYLVPEDLAETLSVGCRVMVPLGGGNRQVLGYCVKLEARSVQRKLKYVASQVDPVSLLTQKMLDITQWIAERYLTPWSQVLETALPAAVRDKAGTRPTTLLWLNPDYESQEKRDAEKFSRPQQQVILALIEAKAELTPNDLMRLAGTSHSPLQTLRKKGVILSRVGRVATGSGELGHQGEHAPPPPPPLELTADQQAALTKMLAALRSQEYSTILLHGVTGSGKTEVYMRAVREVVEYGRQAIILVPEISLTPQTVGRFKARFGEIAVLHSHLTDAQRNIQWQRIARGEVSVVVGARSAIFAPVRHLGMIIIDEEHETSFKQGSSPRYHAVTVAKERARREQVPLVLGSATPSLESWVRAAEGKYDLISMPTRVGNKRLPLVATIDLRERSHREYSSGAISRKLHNAMHAALEDQGQIILLLNRRGFSTHIQCPKCGEVVRCPDCEIPLVHHRSENIILCHYCDFHLEKLTECPSCEFHGIRYGGFGTEKLEAEVRRRFPDATCLRMDTDTMRSRGSHQEVLGKFRAGEADILLGTQMIAKGLDFPNVTLVGVVNADVALHFPDFRAAERTFHLITQVAGRTGRGDREGRVLVQTLNPQHQAIVSAVKHDWEGFAASEIPLRKRLGYPPFCDMIRIIAKGPHEGQVKEFSEGFVEQLRKALTTAEAKGMEPTKVLGPAAAPFAKLRGDYRYHFLLHGDGKAIREVLAKTTPKIVAPDDVNWTIDVDPLDML